MIKLAICASIAVSALPLNTLKADSSSSSLWNVWRRSKYYVEHQFWKTGGCHHVEEHGFQVADMTHKPAAKLLAIALTSSTPKDCSHTLLLVENGSNIICGAASKGSGCAPDGMLYTLKPGQDPTQTLKNS